MYFIDLDFVIYKKVQQKKFLVQFKLVSQVVNFWNVFVVNFVVFDDVLVEFQCWCKVSEGFVFEVKIIIKEIWVEIGVNGFVKCVKVVCYQ